MGQEMPDEGLIQERLRKAECELQLLRIERARNWKEILSLLREITEKLDKLSSSSAPRPTA